MSRTVSDSGPSVLQSSVFCTVSQDMKGRVMDVHTALRIVLIIIGVINIALRSFDVILIFSSAFWLGGVEVWPLSPVITSICIMSLTVSRGEGLTVISVSSNPKSKWPVLCQILASLCCSPVCSVSQNMKGKLTNIHTALGTTQIIVGVINIVFGILLQSIWVWNTITDSRAAFWIGGVVLVAGIVTILGAKFPSPCLLVIAMILNIVSGALAITAVVLYSVDLAKGNNPYCETDYYYSSYGTPATPSPEKIRRTEICMEYKYLIQMIIGGLDIMMIVLSVLLLCVTISFCVLTGKAWCKKDEDAKSVEDPELHKPLLEDTAVTPAC